MSMLMKLLGIYGLPKDVIDVHTACTLIEDLLHGGKRIVDEPT